MRVDPCFGCHLHLRPCQLFTAAPTGDDGLPPSILVWLQIRDCARKQCTDANETADAIRIWARRRVCLECSTPRLESKICQRVWIARLRSELNRFSAAFGERMVPFCIARPAAFDYFRCDRKCALAARPV